MPAEWEPHAATWLAWPASTADWPGKGGALPWVFAEIARALTPVERVRLLVPNGTEARRAKQVLERAHVDLDQVDFVTAPTDRTWARDFMPLFLTRAVGASVRLERAALEEPARSDVVAVKWRFNGWGRYPNHKLDDAAGEAAARWRAVPTWLPSASVGRRMRRLVAEGGGIEVDGDGTVIVTRECLLSGKYARNPELGEAGTEAALREFLGATRVIWVEHGIEGDDTSGHTDDFVRFVAPGRVFLCEEPNRHDPNHRILADVRKTLARARDARGRRLEIIPLPMPAPLYYGKDRLPASYANFLIANERVLVPTFNDPKDRVALGLIAEHFPGRTVVGIHAVDLVLGLGTLHCSTMQEPLPRAAKRASRAGSLSGPDRARYRR
jgi:agmatine deiminase